MYAVIGAGMGGLLSALRLAQRGHEVTVFEARHQVGGLAGRLTLGDEAMDGGPYILLDRPGMEWVFEAVGEHIDEHLELLPLEQAWRVEFPDGSAVRMLCDLDQMVDALERDFPGAGVPYRSFIQRMQSIHGALADIQRRARPRPWHLLTPSRLATIPFLLRPLGHHLAASGLPATVQQALSVWTRVAGQQIEAAPAPMALVPALVHGPGAWVPRGGMHKVPEIFAKLAEAAGVQFRFGAKVQSIEREGHHVVALLVDDDRIPVTAVVSNAPGIGTHVDLVRPPDPSLNRQLAGLQLQSPGISAWWTADASADVPFLDFRLSPESCELRVAFGAVDPDRRRHGRLLAPLDHSVAEEMGEAGQRQRVDALVDKHWWREGLEDIEVLATRIPREWGRLHHLFRDSMNPAMTAAFMRRGRLPIRSPTATNLYLAGAANHPGQWVSFCAISGLLAADALLYDAS